MNQQKKKYESPEVKTVELRQQSALLSTSDPNYLPVYIVPRGSSNDEP